MRLYNRKEIKSRFLRNLSNCYLRGSWRGAGQKAMGKKALSPVIATVLLVSLGLVIAGMVYGFSREFLSTLSPKVDCEDISFRAEFSGQDEVGIVNIGKKQIEGIVVKERDADLTIREALVVAVAPGKTNQISLSSFDISDFGKTFLVVPMVYAETSEEKFVTSCADRYGLEINLE